MDNSKEIVPITIETCNSISFNRESTLKKQEEEEIITTPIKEKKIANTTSKDYINES